MDELKSLFKVQEGFTIIESLVSIAILGVLIIPLGNIFLTAYEQAIASKHQLFANEMAQKSIEEMKSMSTSTLIGDLGGLNVESVIIEEVEAHRYIIKRMISGTDYRLNSDDNPIFTNLGGFSADESEVCWIYSLQVSVEENGRELIRIQGTTIRK